ncbi:MAG: 4Fe-4S binding protein [Anaerolineae bacterium]|nr:4Fe-4S binding protein [Anaerolineae bacterium]
MAKVSIDIERCTGCGECLRVCSAGAITLDGGKARVDFSRCLGCEACALVCPNGAVIPVVEGELIPTSMLTPLPQRSAPLAHTTTAPLHKAALAVAVTTGTGLALRAVQSLARVAGRWLLSPHDTSGLSSASRVTGGSAAGGRRRRYRQRGH